MEGVLWLVAAAASLALQVIVDLGRQERGTVLTCF
jgi:hypothetical protein